MKFCLGFFWTAAGFFFPGCWNHVSRRSHVNRFWNPDMPHFNPNWRGHPCFLKCGHAPIPPKPIWKFLFLEMRTFPISARTDVKIHFFCNADMPISSHTNVEIHLSPMRTLPRAISVQTDNESPSPCNANFLVVFDGGYSYTDFDFRLQVFLLILFAVFRIRTWNLKIREQFRYKLLPYYSVNPAIKSFIQGGQIDWDWLPIFPSKSSFILFVCLFVGIKPEKLYSASCANRVCGHSKKEMTFCFLVLNPHS